MALTARERASNATVQNILTQETQWTDVVSTIQQTNNGVRGYLITGRPISRENYEIALANLPGMLAALDAGAAGANNVSGLAVLHRLIATELAQLARINKLIDQGNKAQAAALTGADIDVGTMNDLRGLTDQTMERLNQKLIAAAAAAARDGAMMQEVTAAAVLGTLLLAWLVMRSNLAQTCRLRDAEAALAAGNAALEQKISERTKTLEANEHKFRTLAECIPNTVFVANALGANSFVSGRGVAFSGLPAAAMQGDGWLELLHTDDRAACEAKWRHCVASGEDFFGEFRLRRYDGAYRWLLFHTVPIKSSQGVITGWIGTATDIDTRHRTEAETAGKNALLEEVVAETAQELQQFFDLSQDILAVINFDRQPIALNPAWERITGRGRDLAMARDYLTFIHPDDITANMSAGKALTYGKPITLDMRMSRADGGWSWISWRAVTSHKRELIFAVGRDVTAERERDEQLRQSQKMEVVGQLTGGLAHDFNNLLTIIMGNLELLQRGMEDAPLKLLRRLEAAMDASRRAAMLTHRMLAFSRRQPLDPAALDAGQLLAGMSDMLTRSLGETIRVEIIGAAGLWQTLVDANQLENAILNLAVNARDAMPDGGTLKITTRNVTLPQDDIVTTPAGPPGQYVSISVSDSGTGMAPEIQAKAFEPFFTTKPTGKGTGLGLAQVYGFINQSGGYVQLFSQPELGTSVTLFLPRLEMDGTPEANPAVEPSRHAPSPPVHGHGELVLVVEDEAGVRQFAHDVLSDLGYRVLTAETASEALDICAATPQIRLLFTDIVLAGGIDGHDLADRVNASHPDMLFLYTTGYDGAGTAAARHFTDGPDFISKPFTAAVLGDKIARLLETKRVMP